MRKVNLISGLALSATMVTLSATEFPFTFQALTYKEAMALPGGYGAYGSLTARKPSGLKREPRAVSEQPLYGELGRSKNEKGFLIRADESGGTGKGYDQLILDLNQNGDLTDDPVIKPADAPPDTKGGLQGEGAVRREISYFGPIGVPNSRLLGTWRPVYFAELTRYRRKPTASAALLALPSLRSGRVRMRAGYYLEATIELGGIKQKIGVVDGNANLRLGEEPKATTYRRNRESNWYFGTADAFLRDTDGSGKFNNRTGDPEFSPFGPVLYFGATPYRVMLAANYASMRVEPWPGALAELNVQPRGVQVRELLLAWQRHANDWVLIKPGVVGGRAKVPPGRIRLTGCVLEDKTKDGQPLVLKGSYRRLDKTVVARAGQTTTLNCGPPLTVRLTVQKASRSETTDLFLFRFGGNRGSARTTVLMIEAEVLGAGGETFSTFAKGRNLEDEPAKPRFTIRSANGMEIASGKLDYG